jgi:hypothetical protein
MWPRRGNDRTVTCIACGDTLSRSDAREYDKLGDRWDRDGKRFEYLCKPCFRDLCHLSRDGLENALVESEAGTHSTSEFLTRYLDAVDAREAEREP